MSRARRLCLCAATPPPPPLFTLDDRAAATDFSPDPTASDLLPVASSPSPRAGAGSRSPSWDRSRGKASAPGSPMDGVVEPPHKELLALPPPSSPCTPPPPTATSAAGEAPSSVTPATEAARTEPVAPASEGKADGEEWVTVFGFSLRDTNLVLREFEKCGVILRNHSGPREGNWIHILYQRAGGRGRGASLSWRTGRRPGWRRGPTRAATRWSPQSSPISCLSQALPVQQA